MFKQLSQIRAKRFIMAAMVLTLVGGFAASLVFARLVLNTIDPIAIAADKGRHLVVTGPMECTARERAYLRVTVSQRSTGAVAEGSGYVTCTGVLQQWEVHAVTQGAASFAPGDATAVALASASARGKVNDAHQWLVNITLVGE